MLKSARVIAWLLLAALVIVTVCPIEYRPHPRGFPVTVERLGAFALIAFLFAIGYPQHRWRVCVLIVVAAGGLEASQMLDPSRHGRVADFAVKALGAVLGVAGAFVISRFASRPAKACA
ncbi:VanZ family protein [Methylobacterium sp. J-078]|uniref:VanZ family protein n=1 Tax=Methylobacterium sp. J-078 TaxID=2836657 RepID=UPI001FB86A1B|nr:VanZ family protein [Methylobacterium sp. J-078]MCJ2044757.1 VanZ family protein [Methylobacterium sp. J-078]